jgi:hypothetical protein
MQEGQLMLSSTTTEVFINNEKAKDKALDVIASPWCWRHEAISWLCVLIAIEFWTYHSLINNHPWLSKTFDTYSMVFVIPSTFSFLSYRILSLSPTSNPSFPESRDEIPFKDSRLSHIEISILKCEPFSKGNLKFSKRFRLYSFKMILFELKWVYKVKRFNCCSKFIHLDCEYFQTIFYSLKIIQKDLNFDLNSKAWLQNQSKSLKPLFQFENLFGLNLNLRNKFPVFYFWKGSNFIWISNPLN